MSLTLLTATSRVTVFPLESLTVAYTTQSCDERGLGDIGLVAIVDERSDGDELWRLARELGGRTHGGDQARWILTQASRARMVKAYTDLPAATWTAYIRRRFVLDALFANHEVLMTGRVCLGEIPSTAAVQNLGARYPPVAPHCGDGSCGGRQGTGPEPLP